MQPSAEQLVILQWTDRHPPSLTERKRTAKDPKSKGPSEEHFSVEDISFEPLCETHAVTPHYDLAEARRTLYAWGEPPLIERIHRARLDGRRAAVWPAELSLPGARARFGFVHWTRIGELEAIVSWIDTTRIPPESKPLLEEAGFMRQVIDLNPGFVFSKDPRGAFTLANVGIARAYGTTVGELLGKTDADFNDDIDEVSRFKKDDLEVIEMRHSLRTEESITDSKGRKRWLETFKVPIDAPGSDETWVLGVSNDITGRKRIEIELRKSQQELENALTAGRIGTAEYDFTTHRVLASKRFAEMFGFEAGERSADDYIERVHPVDRAQLTQRICESVHATNRWQADLRLSLPRARPRWLSLQAAAERDRAGHTIRMRGTAVEITERKLSELSLESQNRMLQMMNSDAPLEEVLDALVDSVSNLFDGGVGAIFLKRDRHLELISSTELRDKLSDGLRAELSENVSSFVTTVLSGQPEACSDIETAPNWDSAVRQALLDLGYRSCMSYPIQLSDGKTIGCFSMYFPTSGSQTDPERVVLETAAKWANVAIGNFRAADEKRALEQQMLQAQKLESLGILAGGIAHDFNNILTGIMGNASLAMMDMAHMPQTLELLRRIENATLRASELTNQMLAYSGKGSFIIQTVNLSSLVGEMRHLLESVLPKKLRLVRRLGRELPCIEGDVTQLRQLIMSLAVNGAEAIGDEKGEITIHTTTVDVDDAFLSRVVVKDPLPKGRYVALEVSDTGEGMDEATRVRIFDPFFTTKFTGRGLGLAAALGVVRAHHGAIYVDSRPGEGTSVRVVFPPIPQTATADAFQSTPERTGQAEKRILVVDDEPLVLEVASHALESAGYEVVTATNGKEALATFRALPVAAVLLDLSMPEMDGHETFVAMNEIRAVPIVLTSGFSESEMSRRFHGRQPAGFLQKPFRATEVPAEIERALQRSQASSRRAPIS